MKATIDNRQWWSRYDLLMMLLWSCRIIFIPLWLFHGIVARGRFSMPAPSLPHGRHVRFTYWLLYETWPSHCMRYHCSFCIQLAWFVPFCLQWAPCHSIVAAPLLIAFELLLCIYLESIRGRVRIHWVNTTCPVATILRFLELFNLRCMLSFSAL